MRLVDLQYAAVGRDDLGAEQLVDREPVLAHEIAGTAAEGDPADADGRRVAEADGEAVRRSGSRDLAGGESAAGAHDAFVRVDLERGQPAQVEHDAPVAHAVTRAARPLRADGRSNAT